MTPIENEVRKALVDIDQHRMHRNWTTAFKLGILVLKLALKVGLRKLRIACWKLLIVIFGGRLP